MRPLVLLVLALSACTPPSMHRAVRPSQSDVRFTALGLYPEGVAFDPRTGGFLVSSYRYGTVGRVGPDGTYRPFAAPGPLVSTLGLAVDAARGRLLVAGGDLGVGERSSPETQERQAGVAAYDLDTGALLTYSALDELVTGRHLANDLALDAAGNTYATDSFAGVLYRLTPEGEASVFARSALFAAEEVGLNGLVAHPDGFLLVTHYERGALLRVGLDDPALVEPVALPEAFVGADGLTLLQSDRLVLVQGEGHDRALLLQSHDGWRSASLVGAVPSVLSFPTAATVAEGAVFVLNAKLEELFSGAPPSSAFLLQRVTF